MNNGLVRYLNGQNQSKRWLANCHLWILFGLPLKILLSWFETDLKQILKSYDFMKKLFKTGLIRVHICYQNSCQVFVWLLLNGIKLFFSESFGNTGALQFAKDKHWILCTLIEFDIEIKNETKHLLKNEIPFCWLYFKQIRNRRNITTKTVIQNWRKELCNCLENYENINLKAAAT